MADPFNSFSGKISPPPPTESSEADPFLLTLPDRDSISILMDETPLPLPDELPDVDEITEEEVASIGAAVFAGEQPDAAADTQADAPLTEDASTSEKGEGSPEKRTDADERECFMGVLCLPKNITMISHWAHDIKLGSMTGRTVIGVLAAGCVFALFLVLVAAFFRNDSMRGILHIL